MSNTIDKAVMHPEVDEASVRVQVVAIAVPAGCLGLGDLILVVREDQIPAFLFSSVHRPLWSHTYQLTLQNLVYSSLCLFPLVASGSLLSGSNKVSSRR